MHYNCTQIQAIIILGTYLVALQRNTEQNYAFQSLFHKWTQESLEFVYAPSALAGQRSDLEACVWIISDEDRIHEH